MWGQDLSDINTTTKTRIIPTRVGTSRRLKNCNFYAKDHPHACGDKDFRHIFDKHFSGSSPRVWGQALKNASLTFLDRIIPTRVGTRIISSLGFPIAWDHPHACGDKFDITQLRKLSTGSSPRVWGQDCCKYNFNPIQRIIPTRVGTSLSHYHSPNKHRDHPHACGDKLNSCQIFLQALGSSPRVWGQAPPCTL